MPVFRYQIFVLFMTMLLTACNAPLTPSNNDIKNDFQNSPYAQFKQERASIEPLIETSSILAQTRAKKVNADDSKVSLPQVKPLDVEGNLEIAGSTELFPLNRLIYDLFITLGYSGLINFNTIGTNESIKLFCQAEKLDLLTLTRPMNKSEIATCRAKDIEPVNFNIGKDAVAIVVSRQNNFLNRVTMPMLADILTKEKWSDVDPSFPNQPIEHLLVSSGSSFDLVVDKLLEQDTSLLRNARNTTLYWYEQPMIQRLSSNIYGISFLSHAAYKKASNTIKSLIVDGTTPESIKLANKTYPFERSLYLYVDHKQLKNKPQLNSFINFYLTHVNEKIEDAGLFPLTPQELDKSKSKFLQTMRSSRF